MKKIQNLIIASAAATVLLTGCAEAYESDFNVEKPADVALAETLNGYEVLKNYTGVRLGAEMASNDAVNRNVLYSQVLTNFNEVTLSDAFQYSAMVSDEGEIDVLTMESAVNNAAQSGMNIFGTAMFDPAQFNLNYMKVLTKNLWIPGTREELDQTEDFESYDVNAQLEGDNFSTIVNDPDGQNGKVFYTNKNAKQMSIPVKLPNDATLNDVEKISFDYRTNNIKKVLLARVKTATGIAEKQLGIPETKDTWTHYEINVKSSGLDGIPTEELSSNEFYLVIGQSATPQKVYVDNVKLHIAYVTEGHEEERPIEEKAADVKKGLNDYTDALVGKYGDEISTWTVASNLLDDFLGEMKSNDITGDPNDFYPNDYLGENYIVDICKNIHAAKPEMKLFYAEGNMLGNDMKQDGLKTYLAQWNGEGAQIAGVDINAEFAYNEQTMEETKANYEALLNNLKETGLLVRLSNLNVYPTDETGVMQDVSQVTTEQLQKMSVFYNYIVQKYLEIIPQAQQYGLSFASVNASSQSVGLWKNNNRLPTYVGVANGLQSKETVW